MNEEERTPEIVIIRRGGHGEDEGHHGGMWKIAYADFMTAMMALFLVLWLVNSTDEQTQAQIASYFNPIDLSASTTADRGVHNKEQAGTGEQGDEKNKKSGNNDDKKAPRNELNRHGTSDEALFSDPYDVLSKLASEVTKAPKVTLQAGKASRQENGMSAGGDAFRDPFDPNFRYNSNEETSQERDVDLTYKSSEGQKAKSGGEAEDADGASNPASSKGDPRSLPFADKLAEEAKKAIELAKLKAQQAAEAEKQESDAKPVSAEVDQLKFELFKSVKQSGLTNLPDISIEQTSEGILISVTDQADFEMFALSSAEPKPELVVLMEQLAEILTKERGNLVIRGHTDARPFRSKTYDNWRLSTARAHIAQYMLLRGGLPKERIEKIEGYADRSLKLPSDPNAAQNRRIEILLRPEKA